MDSAVSMKNKTNASAPSENHSLGLYPWQQECLTAWRAAGFHGTVNVVTGAGKTVLALAASIYLKSCLTGSEQERVLRTRIVVPSVPLALQWLRTLKSVLPSFGLAVADCGLYYSGRKESPNHEYMIYVLNSARHVLARHISEDITSGRHILLIIDECHRCTSPENRRIFDFLSPKAALRPGDTARLYHSLGLTATPPPTDSAHVLSSALGNEIFRYGFKAAVKDGYVSSFTIFHTALSFNAAELREYASLSDRLHRVYLELVSHFPYLKGMERSRLFASLRAIAEQEGEDSLAALYLNLSYQRKNVSCMASARSACAVDLISQLDREAKVLLFGELIAQAEQVYRELSIRFPGRVGRYHSQMTALARKNTLEAYSDGRLRILVSCRGLDEGIDVSEASIGIVLSGSSVNRQRIQRLGRILRRREGKNACLYYFYIRQSAEDSVYLSDSEDSFPICDLFYSTPDHAFCLPAYEELATRLLNEGRKRQLSERQLRELRTCLLLGLPRPDWLESPQNCSAKLQSATSRRERNYWLCMKRLSLYREARDSSCSLQNKSMRHYIE